MLSDERKCTLTTELQSHIQTKLADTAVDKEFDTAVDKEFDTAVDKEFYEFVQKQTHGVSCVRGPLCLCWSLHSHQKWKLEVTNVKLEVNGTPVCMHSTSHHTKRSFHNTWETSHEKIQ